MNPQQEHISPGPGPWPHLPYDGWRDTCQTLHRMTQIVGKVRLALEPMTNQWWQVPLYVSVRGLTTGPMPTGTRLLEVEFDFIDHVLFLRTSDARVASIPLVARPVADFYRDFMRALEAIEVSVVIWPVPVEVDDALPLDQDREHASYYPDAAHRFWQALVQADRVLREFRAEFIGKSSPVHFFWGSFDMAVTRFSGRTAPPYPGSAPNLGDWVMREAYSQEVASAGFWPGNDMFPHAAFYAYTYPEPEGYDKATIAPRAASYNDDLREFILRYDDIVASPDPDSLVMEFLRASYAAAADCAHWDRAALERTSQSRVGEAV